MSMALGLAAVKEKPNYVLGAKGMTCKRPLWSIVSRVYCDLIIFTYFYSYQTVARLRAFHEQGWPRST
jgi:hypothetical protein